MFTREDNESYLQEIIRNLEVIWGTLTGHDIGKFKLILSRSQGRQGALQLLSIKHTRKCQGMPAGILSFH